jgi:hypothetical protein
MQVLVQELGMTYHTTYPQFSYRALIDWEIQKI